MKATLPRLPLRERAWLWLHYQRYAFALIGVPAAVLLGLVRATPPWVWIPAALLAIAPIRFGFVVLARWPRKLRATQVAIARIRGGRFAPASIRGYCGDPCFRLVAAEILRRARYTPAERRRVITTYREELRRDRGTLVIIDHLAGTVTTIERT